MSLPLPQELMLPTLRATIGIGGVGPYAEIDAAALVEANITDGQLTAEFDDSATATGPKILHRIAWARSMLKRIGALEAAGHGSWAVTEMGRELANLPDDEAISTIDELVRTAYQPIKPSSTTLSSFKAKAAEGDPAEMSVRELLTLWGVNRRRSAVVQNIRSSLDTHGLRTEPEFTIGSLDMLITLVSNDATTPSEPDSEEAQSDRAIEDNTYEGLTVGNIPSATGGVLSVHPDDNVLTALSHMQAHDYSQLAVMEGEYNLKGAITWESIAKSQRINSDPSVRDCMQIHVPEVRVDQALLATVSTIAQAGFVFARNNHNKISGIVTAADLSEQFAALTRPFLLVGEIENVIRSAVNRVYGPSALLEALDPSDERDVFGAESLTLGEIQRFIGTPERFERLRWPAERKVFGEKLDTVRLLRNEIMHFSPDPVGEDDVRFLRTFLEWLKFLEASHANG